MSFIRKNLLIKSAGTGYSLKIVGLDSKFVGFASVTTSQFDVRIGPVFRLSFVSFVGIALGGLSFNPNPSISIADRGGNKISEFNFGTVTAYISKSPTPNEPLLPSDKCVANIKDGLAVFQKLFINRAGYPYVLGFRANIEVLYSSSIVQFMKKHFTVATT